MHQLRKSRVAYVSSYPPRECGIATFTRNLVEAVNKFQILAPGVVVAVNEKGALYNYGRRVQFQIDRDAIKSYLEAASWINRSNIELVNLQHEFGLFGGAWGEHIVTFLDALQKPVVTTLHNVFANPSPKVREVVEKIAQKSISIVAISLNAIRILRDGYRIDGSKVKLIPHGAPDIPYVKSDARKASLGLKGKIVLSTFGLMSRNKGIQQVVRALPSIIKHYPKLVYLVIGATHPEVRKIQGERYRNRVTKLVDTLGLDKYVRFNNRFLSERELIQHLQATDIYVAPYINRDQVSSGTLVYALVAGKAIVSTPFYHAEELLADGRGLLCRFRSPTTIAKSVVMLLDDEELREDMEKKAYEYGRTFIWSNVAEEYIKLFHDFM